MLRDWQWGLCICSPVEGAYIWVWAQSVRFLTFTLPEPNLINCVTEEANRFMPAGAHGRTGTPFVLSITG